MKINLWQLSLFVLAISLLGTVKAEYKFTGIRSTIVEAPASKDSGASDPTRRDSAGSPGNTAQNVPAEVPTAPEPGGPGAASQGQCASGDARCEEDSEIAQKQRRLACIHIELSDRQYKLEESRTPYLGVAQLYSRLPPEARRSIPFSGFITIARAKQEQISLDYLALGLIKEAMLNSPIPPKLGAEILAVVKQKDEQSGQQLRRLTTICSAK